MLSNRKSLLCLRGEETITLNDVVQRKIEETNRTNFMGELD